MRLMTNKSIKQFAAQYPDAATALLGWARVVEKADWKTSADVKATFNQASIINHERVVFNIGGNKYRLVAAVLFDRGWVLVKWFGTHAAYDKINVEEVQWSSR